MLRKCQNCGLDLLPHKVKYCSNRCQSAGSLELQMKRMRYQMQLLDKDLERFARNLYTAANIYNQFVILQETVPIGRKWNQDIRLLDKDLLYD